MRQLYQPRSGDPTRSVLLRLADIDQLNRAATKQRGHLSRGVVGHVRSVPAGRRLKDFVVPPIHLSKKCGSLPRQHNPAESEALRSFGAGNPLGRQIPWGESPQVLWRSAISFSASPTANPVGAKEKGRV